MVLIPHEKYWKIMFQLQPNNHGNKLIHAIRTCRWLRSLGFPRSWLVPWSMPLSWISCHGKNAKPLNQDWSQIDLVGGAITILKNNGVRQWEGWQPIYEMENKIHVWNHQPEIVTGCFPVFSVVKASNASNWDFRANLVVTPNMTGWWLTYPSEKYEFISWDHYSQYMEK